MLQVPTSLERKSLKIILIFVIHSGNSKLSNMNNIESAPREYLKEYDHFLSDVLLM